MIIFRKKVIIENNIIKKTIIDLHYHGSEDPFDLQKKIADWSGRSLALTLEQALEKINISENVLIIDKIELDIVIGEQVNWLNHLSKELADQLIRNLEAHENNEKVSGIIKKSMAGNFFDTFIYFLKQGTLPWWSDIKRQEDFLQQLTGLIQAGFVPEMRSTLISLLTDDNVKKRVIWQIPDDLFFQFLYQLSPAIMQQTEKIRTGMVQVSSFLDLKEKSVFETEFKKIALTCIGKTEEMELIDKFMDSMTNWADQSAVYSALKKAVEEISDMQLKKKIKELLKQAKRSKSSATENTDEKDLDKLPEVKAGEKINEIRPWDRHEEIEMKEKEGIYLKNAGLVIVAGFLPMIFKKLSLLEDDKITDVNKAACLVNYLAYGENSFAEFELGLAKILCGIEIDTPVDTSIILSEIEKEETNELLLSVIEYWSILKDTSVDGLREAFLLRDGKLSFTDNALLLQVEQKSYDMLLQHIPWNISMIKLPWMNYLLKTEWIF